MAVRAYDVMVVDRPMFDGQRQRDALTTFQKAAGIDATLGANSVGLSYPQYNRYLWGRVPLRTDQVGAFAAAYGITKAELSRALGLLDDEQPSDTEWDFLDELQRAYPENTAYIKEAYAEYGEGPVSIQRIIVEQAREQAKLDRAATAQVAEKRADHPRRRTGT